MKKILAVFMIFLSAGAVFAQSNDKTAAAVQRQSVKAAMLHTPKPPSEEGLAQTVAKKRADGSTAVFSAFPPSRDPQRPRALGRWIRGVRGLENLAHPYLQPFTLPDDVKMLPPVYIAPRRVSPDFNNPLWVPTPQTHYVPPKR